VSSKTLFNSGLAVFLCSALALVAFDRITSQRKLDARQAIATERQLEAARLEPIIREVESYLQMKQELQRRRDHCTQPTLRETGHE